MVVILSKNACKGRQFVVNNKKKIKLKNVNTLTFSSFPLSRMQNRPFCAKVTKGQYH